MLPTAALGGSAPAAPCGYPGLASGHQTKGQQMAERAAIVTGASSGIGLAVARMLGEEGFGITMAARRPEKLDGAVAGLAADGFDVQAVPANVADEDEVKKVVEAHRER